MRLRKALIGVAAVLTFTAQAEAQQLLRDAEIEQWLDDYARPIYSAAGLPAEQIEILLVGDPTINAFAGSMIMGMNTGTITQAATPNEIVGVIAHETGHLAGGHSARSDEVMAAASRPMLLSLVFAAGAIAAGAPQAGIGILGLGQTIGTANLLKYSRGQEASADQAAVTYLDNLGESSAGLITFFSKLRNSQIITGYKINPYMQSHPLATDRIESLDRRAKASPYYSERDTPEEIERLRLIQAKINGFMQDTNVTLRQYPLSDQSDPAHYARAVAYYRGATLDKAKKEIDYLIERYPDNPYYHELKGQMLFEFGHVAESIEPHRKSVELAPANALLRINLGRALIATEDPVNYPEAVTELRAALNFEPDNSFGWFELARAYGGMGQEAMADLATAESRYHAGAPGEAAVFAARARKGLKRGTPEYRQASDIIAAAQAIGQGGRGARRAPTPIPDIPEPSEEENKDDKTGGDTSDETKAPAPSTPEQVDVPDPPVN